LNSCEAHILWIGFVRPSELRGRRRRGEEREEKGKKKSLFNGINNV